MRFCDLQQKEVINVCDCKCLGCVCDLEFDEKDGFITRKEVNDFIQKSPNKKFRDWATSLMNGYSA